MRLRYVLAAGVVAVVPVSVCVVAAQSAGDHVSLECDGPPVSSGVHLDCVVTGYQPAPTTTTTIAPTTTVAPTTTTTVAPTTTLAPTTTTAPPAGGAVTETFSAPLTGWTFVHKRYEPPANSAAPSTATVTGGKLRIVTADQNYGEATMRAGQKYDLSRGPLTVEAEDDSQGWPLLGGAYLLLSDVPSDALSMGSNEDSYWVPGTGPTNAVAVMLRDNCRVSWGPPIVITYTGTSRTTQRGACANVSGVGPRKIVVTPGHVSLQTLAGVEIVAYNAAFPTVGYVQLGVHNHASQKYDQDSGLVRDAITGLFDNLTFSTPGGAPSPTTTTTAAPTTTLASTTTTSLVPSSTAPSTTAPVTTSTTSPGSGVQFFEPFNSDTRARFDWRLQTTAEPPQGDFAGEHDMACNGPDTHRTVHQIPLTWGQTHTNVDVTDSEMVWFCAPGNDPAKGHMMTALDTGSVATLSFTPKQTFNNVTKVCWDQNMNNLGEGKWVNVFVVPAAAYSGDPAYDAASGQENTPDAIPQRPPAGTVDFTWLRGSVRTDKFTDNNGGYTRGLGGPSTGDIGWMSNDDGMDPSPAPRFTICLDSAHNQVVIRRPGHIQGAPFTQTLPMVVAFPTGPVRVIFQDASYNPTKHAGSDQHLTWHWDQITIS